MRRISVKLFFFQCHREKNAAKLKSLTFANLISIFYLLFIYVMIILVLLSPLQRFKRYCAAKPFVENTYSENTLMSKPHLILTNI